MPVMRARRVVHVVNHPVEEQDEGVTRGSQVQARRAALNLTNRRPSPNVDLMLANRRRRWTNIKSTLVQRIVFDGNHHLKC